MAVAAVRPVAGAARRHPALQLELRLLLGIRQDLGTGSLRPARGSPREAGRAPDLGRLPHGRRADAAPAPGGPRGGDAAAPLPTPAAHHPPPPPHRLPSPGPQLPPPRRP